MVKSLIKRMIRRSAALSRTHAFARGMIADSWPYVRASEYGDIRKLVLSWRVAPYTMQNYAGLSNVHDLADSLERENVHGAFVECGVWRGGCAAVMAFVAEKAGRGRPIWLFDSFEGMPEATDMDTGGNARELSAGRMSGTLVPVGALVASIDDVRTVLFDKLRLRHDNIFIVKGWFQDTLPQYRNQIGPVALLRLDADWYESTKVCLVTLYDQVVDGGYIIIDDYGWFPGCRRAVDEFIRARSLNVDLKKVDYTRVYFRKGNG